RRDFDVEREGEAEAVAKGGVHDKAYAAVAERQKGAYADFGDRGVFDTRCKGGALFDGFVGQVRDDFAFGDLDVARKRNLRRRFFEAGDDTDIQEAFFEGFHAAGESEGSFFGELDVHAALDA